MNLYMNNPAQVNYLSVIGNNPPNNQNIMYNQVNFQIPNQNFQPNQVQNSNISQINPNQIIIQQQPIIQTRNQNYANQNSVQPYSNINYNFPAIEQRNLKEASNNPNFSLNLQPNLVNMAQNYIYSNINVNPSQNVNIPNQNLNKANYKLNENAPLRNTTPPISKNPKFEPRKLNSPHVYQDNNPQPNMMPNNSFGKNSNHPEKNSKNTNTNPKNPLFSEKLIAEKPINVNKKIPVDPKPLLVPKVDPEAELYNKMMNEMKREKVHINLSNENKDLQKYSNNNEDIKLSYSIKNEISEHNIVPKKELEEDNKERKDKIQKDFGKKINKKLIENKFELIGENITIEPLSQFNLLNSKLDHLKGKKRTQSEDLNDDSYKAEKKNKITHTNDIRLCDDAHYSIISSYSPLKRIAYCDNCAEKYKEEGIKNIKIKEYISQYQEKLTELLTISNHIIENMTFSSNYQSLKDSLIVLIKQKFDEYIEAIQECREIVVNTFKKKVEAFEKNDVEKLQEISEDLSLKSNEVRKTLITKRYIDMLSMINENYLIEKESLLKDTEETLKILKHENTGSIKNTLIIPSFGLCEVLNRLSFQILDKQSEFSSESNKMQNFSLINWNNNSRIIRHCFIEKMFTYSSNQPIISNCLIEIKINKLTTNRIASIGFSKVSLNLNSGMLGMDLGPNELAIFPNKLIIDKGKMQNSELEFNENDIIYITIESNEIMFRVNSSKNKYKCENFCIPFYLCVTLFNKDDEIEILNIKGLKE